ncbi:hypothetical protein ACJRO7_028421 [Eucalyptus globulus]|uniref:Uncharacterized protein n=1 Tax=Eucalyptus globulus TaxID=34317 RepID=A0ABD3JVN4_EUCGL
MAATVTTRYPPTVRPLSSSRQALLHRPSSSCCPLRPPRDEPALASSRLRVSLPTVGPRKRGLGLPLVLCSLEGQSETDPASPPSDSTAEDVHAFFINCVPELERLLRQVAELIGGKCAMSGCQEIPILASSS